jgi:hypothetical protein
MTSLWIIIGLILASICVSFLGAAFSVVGIGALFSGAVMAVCAMAGSLELAKFVLAAYLHQRWNAINPIMKTYLLCSVVVLSAITSMGIFGFLSNAYQSASNTLEAEIIKVEALKVQRTNNAAEIARLNKSIDEIPIERLTKKLAIRARFEPAISSLVRNSEEIDKQVAEANIRILDIKQKVGPLIYISKAFKIDIDTVVKYLIMVFVSVFDPLAICLVVATTEALESRRLAKAKAQAKEKEKEELKTVVISKDKKEEEITNILEDIPLEKENINEEAG